MVIIIHQEIRQVPKESVETLHKDQNPTKEEIMEIMVALEASELIILEMSANRDSTILRHPTMARAVQSILREF